MNVYLLGVIVVSFGLIRSSLQSASYDDLWTEYKAKYNKVYTNPREDALRKSHFIKVQKMIEEHAASSYTWTVGHNQLSDRTEEERRALAERRLSVLKWPAPSAVSGKVDTFPDRSNVESFDLRGNVCMAPIKNQNVPHPLGPEKACGSCWAHASITPIEYQYCKKAGVLEILSEQHIVDCNGKTSNCNGGFATEGWDYLKTNKPMKLSDYPYAGVTGKCAYNAAKTVNVNVATWGKVTTAEKPDENAIISALIENGPLVTAYSANVTNYEFYKSGVFQCPEPAGQADHEVTIVGFGTDAASRLKYWVIRNSWSTEWGMEGYALHLRGTNNCRIESDVGYVKIA